MERPSAHRDELHSQQVHKFTYNSAGIRTSKTVNGTKHIYYLEGSTILAEEWGAHLVIYLYDESGAPIGMQYRNTTYENERYDTYYFEKNLQGDIIAVYTADGTKIGGYTYDAWGNCTASVTQGTTSLEQSIVNSLNPFRYRGYYYDTETGLYYLQSRYYDPGMGRFLNADDISVITATPNALTDKNLYVYCDNNPVVRMDADGDFWHIVAGGVIGGVIGVVTNGIQNLIEGDGFFEGAGLALASGVASGILASTGVGLAGMVAGNTIISVATSSIDQLTDDEAGFSIDTVVLDGLYAAATSFLGSPGSGSNHMKQLSKQVTYRMRHAFKGNTIKNGLREIGKACSYYGKNTAKYYGDLLIGSGKDFLTSLGGNFITGDPAIEFYKKHNRKLLEELS